MTFEDLKELYLKKKAELGNDAYQHISAILKEAKKRHKTDWEKKPTSGGDHEQSWRAFKGKNMEKLILYIIQDSVEAIGLNIVSGKVLNALKQLATNLPRLKGNCALITVNMECIYPMSIWYL
ncbi:MAG: hypothetical protein RMI34_01100 [Chloroherpetonaceae bacterium]|nr:hypothetical protein [Chloroherpetonaceae bacterium]MDW8018658.1 hypothetical protein [Chloroherpetonaceae bacterium]